MDIRINLIHHPLYVLGPGKRVGLWVQGCSFGCEGCISKQTWDKNKGTLYNVVDLSATLLKFKTTKVTITGGEPFEQASALKFVLQELRHNGIDDILIYSGFEYDYLRKNFNDILELVDVLIVGLFEINQPTKFVYKGSANQKMIILNKTLKQEYQAYKSDTKRRLQVIQNEEVFVLGILDIKDEVLH